MTNNRGLSQVFANLRSSVRKKWPENAVVPYTAVSGFIFLRLFVAAILSPSLFGLWDELPDQKTSRALTIIAKTVQNAANLVLFGQKEAYMEEMNEVITANLPEMKKFLDDISAPRGEEVAQVKDTKGKSRSFFFRKKDKTSTNLASKALQSFVDTDVPRECSQVYHYFSKAYEPMLAEFQRMGIDLGPIQELKSRLDVLEKAHEEARKLL